MVQQKPRARDIVVDGDDDGVRLDRWFHRHMPDIAYSLISRWARTGQIRLDGARVQPGDRLTTGQVLRLPPIGPDAYNRPTQRERKPMSEEEIEQAAAMVIHRDRAALVLNKPPGLATQGGSKTYTHVDGMLDALVFDGKSRPRLVHRLDKDTSGVLLLARTPGAAAFFSKRFSGRSARKTYWAIVMGVPKIRQGIIDLPLAKQPGTGGEKMQVYEEGQPAKTRYQVVESAGTKACWLALQPLTGRTHQLRVHCAAIGHPIVGDGKYGGKQAYLSGQVSRKMHLHARELVIGHPDGDVLRAQASLPPHFVETLEQLGFDPELGDHLDWDEQEEPSRAAKKQKARAHAKQLRKDRRGERRTRGSGGDDAKRGQKARGKPGPKPGGKAGTKPIKSRNVQRASSGKPKRGRRS